jgi:hypothetical protein
MEKSLYHSTLKTMQEAGASKAYCHGWATGALGNPPLEEQRITDDYTAGYEDGKNGQTDGYKRFVTSS